MDLPTYTNIWRIEKRLYKLYDFRLPMPLPINWIAVFAGITVPYIVLLVAIGLPFNHTLVWLYILPPGVLTWLTTRPVIENKRLPELVESQVRYLTEPRVWTRLAPHNEKDQMVVTARVWHIRQAPQRRKTAKTRAAMGTVALRERNALARRGAAATPIGDPAEGNASLAAASALAAAPATSANSRSRVRARGTGPRVPAPGSPGRQRPPGKRTRPPQQDWAAQQREAVQHDEFPEDTWPAGQPPRAQTTDTEDQPAKPSRFRLSALRPRPTGQAPALPPGVALRRLAEPRRPRFGSPAPSDQAGSAQPWPEGLDRPGQAGPAWRMPAIRSAPPLGSVAAPMSSDLPAHATPDIYPASPFAPDLGPATSVQTAPDEDQVPSVLAAQGAYLGAPVALDSLEVATDTPVSATTLDGESAMTAPAAPEAAPAAEAPDTESATSAPASSEAHTVPSAPATAEVDPGASPAARDGATATSFHAASEADQAAEAPAAPEADLAAQAPAASDAEPAIWAPASSEADATSAAPEVAPAASPVTHDGEAAMSAPAAPEVDPAAEAPAAPDVEPAIWAPVSSEADPTPGVPEVDPGAPLVALDGELGTLVHVVPEVDPAAQGPAYRDVEPATAAPALSEAGGASAAPDVDPGAQLATLDGEHAAWVHVVPEVDPAAQAPAASDVGQAASARSHFETRPAPSASDLGPTAAPGLGNVRSTPAPAPSGGAPRVEISHDGPSQRIVPPAPVPPVNPALAWPSARPEPVDL
ncbi:MAG TPA: TcpE family conjugal transfer membrane protein, partial [Streptosporangiaceae bacterium]|nr:TcpE family conjugal transfer membrane protein [Streptosporangiaceae bacterium]